MQIFFGGFMRKQFLFLSFMTTIQMFAQSMNPVPTKSSTSAQDDRGREEKPRRNFNAKNRWGIIEGAIVKLQPIDRLDLPAIDGEILQVFPSSNRGQMPGFQVRLVPGAQQWNLSDVSPSTALVIVFPNGIQEITAFDKYSVNRNKYFESLCFHCGENTPVFISADPSISPVDADDIAVSTDTPISLPVNDVPVDIPVVVPIDSIVVLPVDTATMPLENVDEPKPVDETSGGWFSRSKRTSTVKK